LHRQRVNLFAHAIAERPVHELMLLHLALAAESRAHDDRFKVLAIAINTYQLALETLLDVGFNLFRLDNSVPQFITGFDQPKRKKRQCQQRCGDYRRGDPW